VTLSSIACILHILDVAFKISNTSPPSGQRTRKGDKENG
jgi:hypothetical protein